MSLDEYDRALLDYIPGPTGPSGAPNGQAPGTQGPTGPGAHPTGSGATQPNGDCGQLLLHLLNFKNLNTPYIIVCYRCFITMFVVSVLCLLTFLFLRRKKCASFWGYWFEFMLLPLINLIRDIMKGNELMREVLEEKMEGPVVTHWGNQLESP